jgi:hypothetical protein
MLSHCHAVLRGDEKIKRSEKVLSMKFISFNFSHSTTIKVATALLACVMAQIANRRRW